MRPAAPPTAPTPDSKQPSRRRPGRGRAQLSLVEHALCPLAPAASLVPNLVHDAAYGYTDKSGHAKTARARVAATLPVKTLKARLARSAERLREAGILRLPPGAASAKDLFVKKGVGDYAVTFHRGSYFDRPEATRTVLDAADSPLVDPLRSIGFDDKAIQKLLRSYKPRVLREWADITLGAWEKHGDEFFSKSAAAYFLDNVKHAAAGTRTAPDWWRQMRVEELRKEQERRPVDGLVTSPGGDAEAAFRRYLESEAKEAYAQVVSDLRSQLTGAGADPQDAAERAEHMARAHFRNRFRQAHPDRAAGAGPLNLAELMRRRLL